MKRATEILRLTLNLVAIFGACCLLLLATLSVVDIFMRELTGRPLRGAHDFSKSLILIVVASCFPAGLLERRQIKVTIIEAYANPAANRAMRLMAELLTGFMFVCIAWFLTQHAAKIGARSEVTMVLHMPLAPFWWIAAGLFWVCVPTQFLVIMQELAGIRPSDERE